MNISKKSKQIVLGIVTAVLFLVIAQLILIVSVGLSDNIQKADLAVVFGNEVKEDGTLSDRLKARLDKAVEIYESDLADKILVSGGIGKEGFDEAKVMHDYLIGQKIPENIILQDNEGINTEATAKNAVALMKINDPKVKNWDSVILVSQFFHLARAKLAFEQAGITEIYTAHADFFELRDIYSLFREFFAFNAYLLKG